jgi:hypothetical protein
MSEMESFLATVELFRELGPQQLREICEVEHYAAGTEILEQGAQANMPAILAGYERLEVRQAAAQTN